MTLEKLIEQLQEISPKFMHSFLQQSTAAQKKIIELLGDYFNFVSKDEYERLATMVKELSLKAEVLEKKLQEATESKMA